MTGKNYLEMSDEDFLKLPENVDGVVPTKEEEQPTPEEPVKEEPPVVGEPQPVQEEPKPEEVVEKPEEPKVEDQPDEQILATDPKAKKEEPAKEEPKKEGEEPAKVEEPKAETPPDYEAFYKQIIAPIKANGKTIDIKSAEDAIRLMQMGAGFGRKMQDIQPHLKTLRFLEQNNLLNVDQAELAFLVDLRNKNPDAIKKLIKDAGIDPLDINNEEPVNYRTNIPAVTDQQVVFREALDNIALQDKGIETIAEVNKNWDPQSHQALMNDPALIGVIHEHRQIGIYDRIVSEMDRQKALGTIPHSTPFIAAYKQVGDHLRDTNGFADLIEKARPAQVTTEQPKPQLLDTRVAAPKPSVSNNAQAKAAATTKTTPKKAAPLVNPLAMSDEDFEKQYGNRF